MGRQVYQVRLVGDQKGNLIGILKYGLDERLFDRKDADTVRNIIHKLESTTMLTLGKYYEVYLTPGEARLLEDFMSEDEYRNSVSQLI